MDNIAAFLNATSTLCVTFTIENRLVRGLPYKPSAPPRKNERGDHLLIRQNEVSLQELPDKLQEARFWLPRAYRKPIRNNHIRVNAVFHLVKCDEETSVPDDSVSENSLRVFQNLCRANNYRLCLFEYECPGSFGLHCMP